ncbi:S1 family serine peptidase [Kitasatospora sp. LaBMicrA B282]|uniref:S1 family serine peptidase n=1 Tax=Kitasatospora sp. LaBMicrA B282 TaxID=3420949 RepID=UPI003D0A4FCA
MSFRSGARRTGLATAVAVTVGLLAGPQAQALTGGTPAGPGQDLEEVAFLHPDGSLACEGSIISATAVLTSAACVDGEHGLTLAFRYGSHDDHEGGHIALIGTRVIHPDYDPATHDADIAVVHPLLPMVLDANAQPVQLATAGSDPGPGATLIVSGWGDATTQQPARAFPLPVIPDEQAKQLFSTEITLSQCQSAVGSDVNPTDMLCAQSPGGSACGGDSGGPLTLDGPNGRSVLVGATSFGIQGCPKGAPSVFTRVSTFNQWIKDMAY